MSMSDVIEHKKTQAQENDDDGPIKDDSLLLEMRMLQICGRLNNVQ